MAQPVHFYVPPRVAPLPASGLVARPTYFQPPATQPQPPLPDAARAFAPVVEAEVELPAHTPSRQVALPPAGRWLVRAAVLAVAVAAPLVAFAGERKVSLDVEGEVRTVRTYAPDAQQLLERRGIETGKPDLVKPGKDGLRDGSVVKFRRAKRIELVLDGERKTVVARGLTVGEALKDLGLVPGPSDAMHPSGETKLRPGLSVFVRNAIHAKLRVDGQLRDVVSSADTVSNMLGHAGVTVGANDYVIPSRDTEPADGMWIRVVRVRRVVEERNVRVPYRYVTRHDADMDSGTRRVVQEGAEGLKVERSSVLYEDGVRVSSQRLDDSVVRPARDHVVHMGTREPQYSGGGSGGGKTQTGIASWFEADGLVAAHRSLPLGSVVKVTNLKNGRSVTVRINQRGPFVEGRVIDLSDDAFERLAPLGDGTIKVKVET